MREDIGKVAVARGPVVYCLEEADNGKDLYLCRLALQSLNPENIQEEIRIERTQELGHPMIVLKMPGRRLVPGESRELYSPCQPQQEREITLRMIPYYAWNNRGEGEMSVWMRA